LTLAAIKITDIKAFWCGNSPFTKIYTSEGITGVGENVIHDKGKLAGQIEFLKRHLVGENPMNIERLWRRLYNAVAFDHAMVMLSAADIALWDIKAKVLGVPVHQLLGGLYRDKVRLYPHLKGTWNSYPDPRLDDLYSIPWASVKYTPDELGKNALELVAEGYTAIKFDPFEPGVDGYHSYRPSEIFAAVERVAAIRDAVGDNIDLIVECHGKFNASTAIRIGKLLEEYDLMWYEEPVPWGMADMMADVRRHVNMPIAAGERFNAKTEIKEYLEKGAIDILMFDCGKVGGITEALKLCAVCETYQVKVAPHNPFGPVAAMANAQLSAAVPSFLILEHEQMAPWAVKPRIKIVNGYLEIPTTPGLGLDIDEKAIAKRQKLIENGTYKPFILDLEQYVPLL
jgi:galactonate dehydratase